MEVTIEVEEELLLVAWVGVLEILADEVTEFNSDDGGLSPGLHTGVDMVLDLLLARTFRRRDSSVASLGKIDTGLELRGRREGAVLLFSKST